MSEHSKEVFKFITSEGKEAEVESRKYTFNLEQVLIDRFGVEMLDEYNKTGRMECDISLPSVEKDFPKLLNLDGLKINWSEQDYDELVRVYLFFIRFKKSALLRAYQLDQRTIVSNLETMSKVLNSLPQSILAKLRSGSTAST